MALDPEGQALMTASRPQAFAAINNAWGRQGWTTVALSAVDEGALRDDLHMAHALAAPVSKKVPLKTAAKKTPAKKAPTKKALTP